MSAKKEFRVIDNWREAELVRDDLHAEGYRAFINTYERKDGSTVYTVYSNGYRKTQKW